MWLSSITHPFDPLVSYVFKKAQGQRAVLPSFVPNGFSAVLQEMYSAALKELGQPDPVAAKKDVLVLLSGIINTVALCGRRFSISKKILQGSRLPPLDTNSADYKSIKALLDDLMKALFSVNSSTSSMNYRGKPQLQSLKRRVWILLSEAEVETAKHAILQIVSQLLLWIELGLFTSPTSEHIFVSSWCTLFNILLFDTSFRAVP